MSQKQVDTKPLHSLTAKIKRAVGIILPVVASIGVGMYISNVAMGDYAISAVANGITCGNVRSESDMYIAATKLESTIYNATAGEYAPSFDIKFELVHTRNPEYLTDDECYAALFDQIDSEFDEGYMLYVGGKQIAAYESREELESLINNIEFELHAKKPVYFSDVKLQSSVHIEGQLCHRSMFMPIEEINALINPNFDETANVTPSNDTSLQLVDTRIGAVLAAAPNSGTADYHESVPSESSNLGGATIVYNYINTVTLTEDIPFETEYVEDPYFYEGTEKMIKEGVCGKKDVTYDIVYDASGKIIERIPVSETAIAEPTSRIVSIGTKKIPAAKATGKFIWPCETPMGVSSGYGWRTIYNYTEFHLGLDIPNVTGSPIWASDGGVVIFAEETPSYGKNIHIVHANGYSTVYAHLDEILVKVGDRIAPGQQIGKMGSTGLSYGTHLHFEVRINNLTIDPQTVLPK